MERANKDFDTLCLMCMRQEISSLTSVFPLQKGCVGEGASAAAFWGNWEIAEFRFRK